MPEHVQIQYVDTVAADELNCRIVAELGVRGYLERTVTADERVRDSLSDELVAAGGLYARMWADYQTAAQWKIGKEVA